MVGGACRTEYPFPRVPGLGHSSGAYLLGVFPPELLRKLGLELPLVRRDPHYFLPTTDASRHILFGSDAAAMQQQFERNFSRAGAWRGVPCRGRHHKLPPQAFNVSSRDATVRYRCLIVRSATAMGKPFVCADWEANCRMNAELAALRDDLAPAWLQARPRAALHA